MATRQARGFMDAFKQAYGEGRQDWAQAYRQGRDNAGLAEDSTRLEEMTGAYPTGIRVMENLNQHISYDMANRLGVSPDRDRQKAREQVGLGLQPQGQGRRTGQMLGTLAADLTQDNTRSFYWLGNAIQALGSIGQESLLGKYAKQLYQSDPILDASGRELNMKNKGDKAYAIENNYIDRETEKPTKGIRTNSDGSLSKARFTAGDKAALLIPSGLAINAGVGLMSPLGGAPGYEALIPSEEDAKVSGNPVLEVGMKYLTGRTGKMLNYDEFSEERPDVSPGEYAAYKAFKYDKEVDLNPFDDGIVNLPGGIAKFTADGIHGPEAQFFGKSLPLLEGGIPVAAAMAATTYGATRKKPITRGLQYGLGGYAVGTAAGAIAEQIRRRAADVSNDQLE